MRPELISISTLILLIALIISELPVYGQNQKENKQSIVELPHSDGYGLVAKPKALSKEESQKMYADGLKACDNECITEFGKILGSANGAIAYSNCKSTCIKPEYSFLNLTTNEVTLHSKDPEDSNLHYIGVIYQCVEYARRWWMLNKGITFGSIDSAFEIIYLQQGKNIHNNKTFPLGRSINGSATRPPKIGDLVIYSADRTNPNWRHGHVAVVTDVDLKNGFVALAEENIDNKEWPEPEEYARRIQLFEVSGRYTLLDVDSCTNSNPDGAAISGWIYPAE